MNWVAAFATATTKSSKSKFSGNSSQIMKINVGGISFVFLRQAVEKYPDTVLGIISGIREQSLSRHSLFDAFLPETGEIYFNRSGFIFHSIAQFYHTGHLHNLQNICKQAFLEELKFWGIYPAYYHKRKCKDCVDFSENEAKRYKKFRSESQFPKSSKLTNSLALHDSSAPDNPSFNIEESLNTAQMSYLPTLLNHRKDRDQDPLQRLTVRPANAASKLESKEGSVMTASADVSVEKGTNSVLDNSQKLNSDLSEAPTGANYSAIMNFHQGRSRDHLGLTTEKKEENVSSARTEVWKVMEGKANNRVSMVINFLSLFFILLNTSLIILDSIPSYAWTTCAQSWVYTGEINDTLHNCQPGYGDCCLSPTSSDSCEEHSYTSLVVLYALSWMCTVAFTFEFLVKLWATPNRLRFFKMPMTIIDILAIAPDYIETVVILTQKNSKSTGFIQILQVFRVVRVFRIFRVIKLAKFEDSFHVVGKTMSQCVPEFILFFIYLSLSTIIFGTILYYLEFGKCGTPYISIPRGVFWAIVTTFTFADAPPVTDPGRFITAFSSIFGIVLMAMPVSILVDKFSGMLNEQRLKKKASHRSHDSLYDEFGRIKQSHEEFSSSVGMNR